ncbi:MULTISPECIES: VOC family protein [unclassified Nesterenkonia]|uniref:VOC family protein n=1 Tax=unclassified Nesterenkonia TaxID=2629769 RepID=UPI001F4CA1F3|nr:MULTISPECIES: VOC family protein [unclassified Nesterenkonia]MCH8560021.1 VOC family protein [Nesterenkonia sp. DZ6]MCH8562201.1 VOC family protein [Nesterenkonia sp. YGD6]MCH8569895.1 VOC family protein [Nesterenkonia sp. AY15]
MTIGLTPYLQFSGTARHALEFYHSVFGGDLEMMTYAQGMGAEDESKDLIMHGSLFIERGVHLMAADAPPGMPSVLGTVSLSNSAPDDAEHTTLEKWWEKLSEGAEINEPMAKSPWGDTFGMLTDRFGVPWMVNASR